MRTLLLVPLLLLVGAAPANERSFMITGFERLRVEGPFDVEVTQGSPKAVAIGDARALDQVSVRVEGATMGVSNGPLGWETRSGDGVTAPPRVRVSVPALRSVALNGGARVRVAAMRGAKVDATLNGPGSLEIAAIKADDLTASLTGTGAMTLAGTATRARVRNYGAGSIDAARLVAGDAELISQSSGNIGINVRFTARATALGIGGVIISGKPLCIVRGTGPIACSGTVQKH